MKTYVLYFEFEDDETWQRHYIYADTNLDNIRECVKSMKKDIDEHGFLYGRWLPDNADYDYLYYTSPKTDPGPDRFNDLMILQLSRDTIHSKLYYTFRVQLLVQYEEDYLQRDKRAEQEAYEICKILRKEIFK